MRILVIGKGAREDTFVWSLRRSGHRVFAAPGNPGMEARGAQCFYHIADDDIEAMLKLAVARDVHLVVIGPEALLKAGIVDRFAGSNIPIVGPTKLAAKLEWSKVFAKSFMARHGIPTAGFRIFSDAEQAKDYIQMLGIPPVVKADGLAAGKGVTVPETLEEAIDAVDRLMVKREFGDAGNAVVLENRLTGDECSCIVLSDGENVVSFLKAKDWKRRFDGDKGKNTGSMGGVCPVYQDAGLDQQILDTIIYPAILGMKKEGRPFRGFLYAGLMLTAHGPQVVEFNVRFGDPETSVILPLLADDVDLAKVLMASTRVGGLKNIQLNWLTGHTVCREVVQQEYPASCKGSHPISGVEEAEEFCLVFHAGTAKKEGKLVTNGGRILAVVGLDETLRGAITLAGEGVGRISFTGADSRTDIGESLLRKDT